MHVPPVDRPDGAAASAGELRLEVRYELAEDGSVRACRVVRPSGEAAIDAASCRTVTGVGSRREGVYRGTLVWRRQVL